MKRSKDAIRVRHVLDAIKTLDRHLKNISEEQFVADELLINLAARQFSVIGEAMNSPSEEFRMLHPELPYREANDMRNFIIHEYFDVSCYTLWQTYKENIPALRAQLEALE
jgi:uncharacterized protein with HEPN domain